MPTKPLLAAAALAATILAFASCSDSTAPKGASEVTVAVVTSSYPKPYYSTPGDNSEAVTCNPVFTAIGSGSGEANWIDAKIYWFHGVERTIPDDSSTVSGQEISGAFGSATVAAKDTVTSTWTFTSGFPFTATMIFRYSRNETDTSATASFTCGPPPDSVTSPPALDLPTFTGPDGDLQPGDTIRVTYNATAGAGLWESFVALTGACSYEREFPEALQGSTTRTVSIVLPPTCKLRSDIGATELGIAVGAVDPMKRYGSRALGTGRFVVDKTPPRIAPPQDVTGNLLWFVGDTLNIRYYASDNHQLAMLFWQETISGAMDSIPATGLTDSAVHRIPVPQQWLGQARMRFWARDAVGLTSDTVELSPAPATVAAVVTRPTRTAQIGDAASDAVYDSKRQQLYLAEASANKVAVFSLASMSVTRVIDLPAGPTSIDLTPGGDSLVVSERSAGALGIIDLRDSTAAVGTLPVAVIPGSGQSPMWVRVMANDRAFVALGYGIADSSITEIDLATGAQRTPTDVKRSFPASTFQRSGDHRSLVLDEYCLQRYDVASDSFSSCALGPDLATLAMDWTGATVAVGLKVYDASLTLQRTIGSVWASQAYGTNPPIALSPDGSILYGVNVDRGLIRMRTTDGVTLDATPSVGPYPSIVRLSPDGQTLMLIAGTSITVVDLR